MLLEDASLKDALNEDDRIDNTVEVPHMYIRNSDYATKVGRKY